MKYLSILGVLILVVSCGSSQTEQKQKMVIAGVITHPEKGTQYSELGGESKPLPALLIDRNECYEKEIEKGFVIYGVKVNSVEEIEKFIDSELAREIDDSMSGKKHETKEQKKNRELYFSLVKNNWSCLRELGWSRQMKLVPATN